jgi:DNA-binding response OmpR family regulator
MSALIKRSQLNSQPASILSHKELVINKDSYSVTLSGEKLQLTIKEYELLLMMMENPGKVFRREALLNTIWDYEYYGDGRVIDTNIKTLRKKLRNYSCYIQTVIGVGYKFEINSSVT